MDNIWDRKSFKVGGHWPLWRGWKKRMTMQNQQKLNAKKKKKKYMGRLDFASAWSLLMFQFFYTSRVFDNSPMQNQQRLNDKKTTKKQWTFVLCYNTRLCKNLNYDIILLTTVAEVSCIVVGRRTVWSTYNWNKIIRSTWCDFHFNVHTSWCQVTICFQA